MERLVDTLNWALWSVGIDPLGLALALGVVCWFIILCRIFTSRSPWERGFLFHDRPRRERE
jgi:hypothetical protein